MTKELRIKWGDRLHKGAKQILFEAENLEGMLRGRRVRKDDLEEFIYDLGVLQRQASELLALLKARTTDGTDV